MATPDPEDRPDYGIDAPVVLRRLVATGVLAGPLGLPFLGAAGVMLWGSRVGKLRLRDQLIDFLHRQEPRQRFPRSWRPQVVGGTGLEAAVQDEVPVEAPVARHCACHRAWRASVRHLIPDETLQVGPRQLLDPHSSPSREFGQERQIARITLHRVAGEPPLNPATERDKRLYDGTLAG